MRIFLLVILVVWAPVPEARAQQTENLFLITLDGLRWQELFSGADSALLREERYVDRPDELAARFWADDPLDRRALLMPFFWNVIAEEGQLYGNRELGSSVDVTNGMVFSYPGYNEILVGYPDDEHIRSNAKQPNRNETVLEFINQQDGFRGRVAAFGSWDVFPFIINEQRSGIPVNAGFEPAEGSSLSEREVFLNELQRQIPSPWGSVRLDAFTHHYAREYLEKERPRVVYIAYGETDDFAHDGEYDSYLEAAHRTDAFIGDLWEWAQSTDGYRGTTTLLITTDHGRGLGSQWTSHGSDVDRAREIWLAAMGPDSPARGEVARSADYYQNQVAGTAAALLGLEYAREREVGDVIAPVLGR